MIFVIHQMPPSMWHKHTNLFTKDTPVNRADYVPVYIGNTLDYISTHNHADILNTLFEVFNLHHPKDYPSRSMSPGDIVEFQEKDGEEETYTCYLCCSFGWHKLKNF